MKLSKELQAEIVNVVKTAFETVEYGKLVIIITPDSKYLQYGIEETKRIELNIKNVKTA